MKGTKAIQSINFKELRDLAASVAQTAGEYVLSEYENLILHQTKSSSSDFVTSVDNNTETLTVAVNPCIEEPFLQLLDTARRNANEIY